eukprot:TRINITY_DN755_c0_g1_i2.p1 TRINITY_DN755_c0_g1~~TRINITY_DN755_c0_g1_i2.p1  ORF type:complete len:136 (+),score=9.87 TRINITY_DN755_c0_g1_i2:36-410(+)
MSVTMVQHQQPQQPRNYILPLITPDTTADPPANATAADSTNDASLAAATTPATSKVLVRASVQTPPPLRLSWIDRTLRFFLGRPGSVRRARNERFVLRSIKTLLPMIAAALGKKVAARLLTRFA